MEVKKTRPDVSLEQLELERIELDWVRVDNPPVARTQVVHRRGGKLLVLEGDGGENTNFQNDSTG